VSEWVGVTGVWVCYRGRGESWQSEGRGVACSSTYSQVTNRCTGEGLAECRTGSREV